MATLTTDIDHTLIVYVRHVHGNVDLVEKKNTEIYAKIANKKSPMCTETRERD